MQRVSKGEIMFGHQDANQNDNQTAAGDSPMNAMPTPAASAPPVNDSTVVAPHADTPPSAPAVANDTAGDYIMTEPRQSVAPGNPTPAQPEPTMPAHAAVDDLLSLKQQALQQLSPLVGHLDQTPEEKFRTTMMMIQAADNHALLPDAYAAAQAITDEKTRAQALLDVVNEINYFTQHHEPAA
jgi:hypothetical protein